MQDNRVSAVLTAADREVILQAIQTIRDKLPFLIDLTPEDRRALLKMGDKSRAFVSGSLALASQNAEFLPRSFDVSEMRRDVELYEQLAAILIPLSQLQELMDDTLMELGSEAYAAALVVYQYAKSSGQGSGLDGLLDTLGQRFARKLSKPTQP